MLADHTTFMLQPDDRLPPHICTVSLPEGGSIVFHTMQARQVLGAVPEGSIVSVSRPLFDAIRGSQQKQWVH